MRIHFYVFLTSCIKEEEYLKETINTTDSQEVVQESKLLVNPYEIENMRTAYQKILDKVTDSSVTNTSKGTFTLKGRKKEDIEPNYIYVRFDPKNEKQETRLKDKKRLLVIDYPFEYENSQDYHKTINLVEGEIPKYWSSIPIDTKLPANIPYTILQEMYIPEKDPKYNGDATTTGKQTEKGRISDEIDLMNHVLEEAYAATDNTDLLPTPETSNTKADCKTCFLGVNLRSLWRPSGRLEIWDDNILVQQTRRVLSHYEYYDCSQNGGEVGIGDFGGNELIDFEETQCQRPVYRTENVGAPTTGGYMPLAEANVLIRDTWTLDNAITDSNGRFSFKRVRAKVKYIIQWDRFQFSIRDDTGLFQAEDKGPKLYDEPWNYKIKGGREEYRGKIFQGAHYYFYGNIDGLRRPPNNNIVSLQTKIRAREDCCSGINEYYLPFLTSGRWPTITIKAFGRTSPNIVGVTIHELAHSTHADGAPLIFPVAEKRMRETYATTIEWYLTNRYYQSVGVSPNWEYDNRQDRTAMGNPDYTSYMIDLIDDNNQNSADSRLPFDRVSGYTIQQIEKYTFDNATMSGLTEDLIRYLDNSTEQYVWELRNQWD